MTFILAVLALPIAIAAQAPQRTYPYQAFVNRDGVPIYSGPGSAHYATDELAIDTVVEVHRHDPGGWCAIRPPRGSFSLIPAMAIERLNDDTGEVVEGGVQAWVGTKLGAVENPLFQIKMKAEELVKILGEVSWPNPEGHSTVWYQISPPSGEFRWIRLSDIKSPSHQTELPDAEFSNQSPNDRINTDVDLDGSGRVQAASFEQDDPVFDETVEPPSDRDSTVNRGWRQATTPIRIADRRSASGSVEPFKIPAIDAPSKSKTVTDESLSQSLENDRYSDDLNSSNVSNSIPNEVLAPLSGPVSQRMSLLESSLTTEMLKSPKQWDLETILKQATAVSTNSRDLSERQHAVRLITKIRRCIAIQSSFESAYEAKLAGFQSSEAVGTGVGTDSQVQLGTQYDAYGWLNQLVRGKGSLEPTYVIENDQGQIIYHVAPSPGLNLNRYLKQKVGVIGRRGFHRELQMNHVTAERIVELNSVRR